MSICSSSRVQAPLLMSGCRWWFQRCGGPEVWGVGGPKVRAGRKGRAPPCGLPWMPSSIQPAGAAGGRLRAPHGPHRTHHARSPAAPVASITCARTSRHCLPMRPSAPWGRATVSFSALAIADQLPSPYSATSLRAEREVCKCAPGAEEGQGHNIVHAGGRARVRGGLLATATLWSRELAAWGGAEARGGMRLPAGARGAPGVRAMALTRAAPRPPRAATGP